MSHCSAAEAMSCGWAPHRAGDDQPIKFKLNMDSLEHVAAEQLQLNEIGVCELELDRRSRSTPTAPIVTWAASC